MNGYVYEQFGMWWVYLGETRIDGKKLHGPFRSREQAAASLREPPETCASWGSGQMMPSTRHWQA